MTLNLLKAYRDKIGHFNLSPSGLFFNSEMLLNCTLDEFLTDTFKIKGMTTQKVKY